MAEAADGCRETPGLAPGPRECHLCSTCHFHITKRCSRPGSKAAARLERNTSYGSAHGASILPQVCNADQLGKNVTG